MADATEKKSFRLPRWLWHPASSGRIDIIDGLRGLSIILMVAHHFGFDLVEFCGAPPGLVYNRAVGILSPSFAGLFIFLSGICCRFSHNNLKRGIITFLAGWVVTLGTLVVDMPAWWGILHFMGAAAILFTLIRPALDKITDKLSRPVMIGLFVILFVYSWVFIYRRYFNVEGLWWLGFQSPRFSSSDYFPILPWIWVYLAGSVVGRYIVERKLPERFYTQRVPVLADVGRNTLIVYLLHQPVLYAICLLINAVK